MVRDGPGGVDNADLESPRGEAEATFKRSTRSVLPRRRFSSRQVRDTLALRPCRSTSHRPAMAALTALGAFATREAQDSKRACSRAEPVVRKSCSCESSASRSRRHRIASAAVRDMGYVGARSATTSPTDRVARRLRVRRHRGSTEADQGRSTTAVCPRRPASEVDDSDRRGQMCPADGPPCRRAGRLGRQPAPVRHDFRAGVTKAQWQASVDAVFTPFSQARPVSRRSSPSTTSTFRGRAVGWNKRYGDRSTARAAGNRSAEVHPDRRYRNVSASCTRSRPTGRERSAAASAAWANLFSPTGSR